MFYCSIDIAKRNHEASVIDAEGKPLLDSVTIINPQKGSPMRKKHSVRRGPRQNFLVNQ